MNYLIYCIFKSVKTLSLHKITLLLKKKVSNKTSNNQFPVAYLHVCKIDIKLYLFGLSIPPPPNYFTVRPTCARVHVRGAYINSLSTPVHFRPNPSPPLRTQPFTLHLVTPPPSLAHT